MSLKKINGYTLNLNKQLGRGNFGVVTLHQNQVYLAQQDGTKIQCAIKMLDKMRIDADDYVRSAIFREIQILKNLRCDHIVGFYDVMESSRYYYIIQELCDTDLQKLLRKVKKLDQTEAINYLMQICDGFLCLIKEGIVHRDLKPANIMMKNGSIKLGDFGLAKRCRNKRLKIDSSVGSPLYMSIELLKQQQYSSKCDIWAVACVFYQMLHGKTPWHAKTQYNLVTIIQKQNFTLDEKLNQSTKDFLRKSLQKKQIDRLSWDQLFLHPIFKGKFIKYSQRNQQFQNKLKMIMSDIRFKINAQHLNLQNLFQRLGFTKRAQLTFKNFDEFIRIVNPSISTQQIVYFFQKLDQNDDGKILIKQLQQQMLKNHISLQNMQTKLYDQNQKNQNLSYCSKVSVRKNRLNQQLQFKIRKCFIKLSKILSQKKLSLYKTFQAYDQNKQNRLNIHQFSKILTKLDNTLSKDQFQLIFDYIDKDNSSRIQFYQLNTQYCKANGVDQIVDLLPEHFYAKSIKPISQQITNLQYYFKNYQV